MFVFDTETRTDATQRLTFGSYRFLVDWRCLEEGLFYADDLPREDQQILKRYVETHSADVQGNRNRLLLLTRREFLNKLYKATYKSRCLLVGFNLPFDLSRVAFNSTSARGRFAGGFSLGLWSYVDKSGRERANHFRPRIGIKVIDSKRALKGFTSRNSPDLIDLIPETSATRQPERGYKFRGHFLDLRTLAFALTDRGYSLEGACEAFGVEHKKQQTKLHGEVSEEYVDYNRRDVLATSELAVKLLEEYGRHPINLQPTRAYSPAAIGKGYLRAMGIKPVLQRQPNFPRKILGHAQSAFYGGRTSAKIRKVIVPVVYTDFLSMYPTVNRLMNLWSFTTAREIRVAYRCEDEIRAFLESLTPKKLFMPRTWKNLTGFVKVVPDNDALPSRAKYSLETNDWQVAVNYLHGDQNDPNHALWFSLPDVAASVLLTGRVPRILSAFRLKPQGTSRILRPTRLRGAVRIDPQWQDFFRVVIEERKRLDRRTDLSSVEKQRLNKALKVLANATSYGIYAEMQRQETEQKINVTCHGIDSEPFTCRVAHPDNPGEYCFPPMASLITGAARLMLALLEYCVSELGGTYAMEDTDSMAIVSTKKGGTVSCDVSTIKALSWRQVRQISERFASLNPYARDAIPGSVLKIENDNFEPQTGVQRQLYCFAISAKRYALFVQDSKQIPVLLREGVNNEQDRWSEHGLGHLLNPTDPDNEDREWIAKAWLAMIRKSLRLSNEVTGFKDAPAVGRVSVSSPAVMRPLHKLNAAKPYADQIKPFNFLLSSHVRQFGHPIGVDPEHFHLIAPYESNPRRWPQISWVDQYTGKSYRVTTTGEHGTRHAARVKTYGDVLLEYEYHPESKCADEHGSACRKQTVGVLQRRRVAIDHIKFIGKESNSMEDVEAEVVHSEENIYTEYSDSKRDEWQTTILPVLKKIPLKTLMDQCLGRISRRALIEIRAGRSRPHPNNREFLIFILQEQKKRGPL